jgi:amidase
MDRRSFVATGFATTAFVATSRTAPRLRIPLPPPAAEPFALEEKTIADLQAAMQRGEYTARALVEQYLQRIESLNTQGPSLRAVIETNPDALAIADAVDAERKAGHMRGPMHGIPVLLKDNVATKDRMQSTAGSFALMGAQVPRDAFIAARLRDAGAILLGKANLSEWANFRSTHSSSGWSGRGGQARNPYALDRSPSGSSSGSGAAAAANLCVVAVGTETDGSVTSPSAACSLVGLKPTVGLLSRAGIVPISHTQDTAGPMARTVRDAAILLGAMVGVDERDGATAASAGRSTTDYTKALDPAGLRGARIGVVRKKLFGYSDAADRVIADALDVLKRQGATLVDPANLEHAGEYNDDEQTVLLYDFKTDLDRYLAELGPGAPVHSIADVIAFNNAHRDTEMPYFGQELMLQAQEKGPLTEKAYQKALANCRKLARVEGIDRTMDQYHLDALIAPTQGPASPIDLVNGDCGSSQSCTTPAAVSGYPHITVPAGYALGLPVGLSFFGRAYSEAALLRFAYAFEQAAPARVPPTFRPTPDLTAAAAKPS